MTAIPPLSPPTGPGRRAFRSSLLQEPVLSIAGFLTSYPAVYVRLVAQRTAPDSGAQLEAEALALALAGDIATVMQSVRGQASAVASDEAGRTVALPLDELDRLFCAFVLLAGETPARIPPEMVPDGAELALALSTPAVRDFLTSIETAGG